MSSQFETTAKKKMEQSLVALQNNLTKISTGRANPAVLDVLKIKAYGDEDMRIDQVANVSTGDNRTLVISVWDKGLVPAIEKAILKSNLGLNPSSTDTVIRLIIPPLTQETRASYSKQAKEETEQAKVSIRNARRDANQSIKTQQKNSDISENESNVFQQVIQKLTDTYIAKSDEMYEKKHSDLMAI